MTITASSPYQVFGCLASPFRNTLDSRFFYRTEQHDEGIARIMLAIEDARGMALVQGAPGLGKTLISQIVLEKLPTDRYAVAFLAEPDRRTTGTVVLKTLLAELGVRPAHALHLLKQQFRELALCLREQGRRIVVVLDEAHLYTPNTLETLRVLLNIETAREKLLTIVMLAQPEINARLKKMPQLDQRIDFRLTLRPLTVEQVRGYVQHRLTVGQCKAVFTDGALDAIVTESRIPRQLNLICDHALLLAAGGGPSNFITESVAAAAIRTWRGEE